VKTIVSVTPLQVSADTRTFKIAASFARFGYRSIVVEGEQSGLDPEGLPFDLRSPSSVLSEKKEATQSEHKISIRKRDAFKSELKERIKRWPWFLQKPLRTLAFPPWYFNRFIARPVSAIPVASLYYLHSPYQFPALYWVMRRSAASLIYDAHDFYSEVSPNIFYKRLESSCIKSSAAVVTVAEGIARLMRGAFGCHAAVVRNCHDSRLEQAPPQDLRQTLGLSPDKFLLVSVGQAKQGQAVREALEALSDLPSEVHLAFVGKNTNTHMELVKRFSLRSRVHLIPAVKQDEVVQFIRSADAALIPYYPLSRQYANCLPNGFFQSIAGGLPLLYPELVEIKKLAEKYRVGIPVDTQSVTSIRDGVMQLLSDPDRISEFKENVKVASLELSWEREESILYKLVKGVLNKGPELIF
jgi:glycosyltransferase involved in cell wall biosynthesis